MMRIAGSVKASSGFLGGPPRLASGGAGSGFARKTGCAAGRGLGTGGAASFGTGGGAGGGGGGEGDTNGEETGFEIGLEGSTA